MCLGLVFLKVRAKDWDNGNVHGLCVCDEVLCVWAWEHRAVLHTSSCFKDVAPRVFLIHDVFFPLLFHSNFSDELFGREVCKMHGML